MSTHLCAGRIIRLLASAGAVAGLLFVLTPTSQALAVSPPEIHLLSESGFRPAVEMQSGICMAGHSITEDQRADLRAGGG